MFLDTVDILFVGYIYTTDTLLQSRGIRPIYEVRYVTLSLSLSLFTVRRAHLEPLTFFIARARFLSPILL